MREIKFRAWSITENRMLSWEDILKEIHYPHGNNLYYLNPSVGTHIIMQFTGLKDKNGKEIYEGDIILYRKLKLQVAFKGAHFIIEDSRTMMHEDLWKAPKILRKVIGNIYENPELLK